MTPKTFEELPEYLTPAEVMDYLRLSRNTVYTLIQRGKLPSRKFGRTIRIPRSALAAADQKAA